MNKGGKNVHPETHTQHQQTKSIVSAKESEEKQHNQHQDQEHGRRPSRRKSYEEYHHRHSTKSSGKSSIESIDRHRHSHHPTDHEGHHHNLNQEHDHDHDHHPTDHEGHHHNPNQEHDHDHDHNHQQGHHPHHNDHHGGQHQSDTHNDDREHRRASYTQHHGHDSEEKHHHNHPANPLIPVPPTPAISQSGHVQLQPSISKAALVSVPMLAASDSSVELPPPYWETKLAKNTELFIELNKIPNMKQFLQGNISIVEQLMKHPDIAMIIARDESLAKKVMERPLLLQEMIDVKPFLHSLPQYHHEIPHKTVVVKSSPNTSDSDKETSIKVMPPPPQYSEETSEVSFMSRVTFPMDAKIADNSPSAIKYLANTNRIFLAHHIEILDGATACSDKKIVFYDILDPYGHILYRAYEGPSAGCCSKVMDIVVREPDGSELIVMKKNFGMCKKTIDIYCPPDCRIGCVEKKSRVFSTSTFHIKNAEGDTTIIVRCKKRYRCKKYQTEFELRTFGDHNDIGKIHGEWLDLPPGSFPSNLVYGVHYPKELNCNVKIGVMAAWFLIYKLYYDGSLAHAIRHDLSKSEREKLAYMNEPSPLGNDVSSSSNFQSLYPSEIPRKKSKSHRMGRRTTFA